MDDDKEGAIEATDDNNGENDDEDIDEDEDLLGELDRDMVDMQALYDELRGKDEDLRVAKLKVI